MASIVERGNTYSVVYYAPVNGESKQVWESFETRAEAKRRKAEVENETYEGTLIAPSKLTIKAYLVDFVSLYGEENWSLSTYSSNIALIDNYINPLIGDHSLQAFNTKSADTYLKQLRKTQAVETQFRKRRDELIGPSVVGNIFKLLRCAFGQAVRWELIKKNPFEFVSKPKHTYQKRAIWTADTIKAALDACRDSKLYVAMNLSFACSLRIGEISGLTWDNVFITDEHIADDNAYVLVEKELQRASLKAIEQLDKKDVIYLFPAFKPNAKTRLVLKTPKTESSVRKVWLPKTLAYILREYKKSQDAMKSALQDEYFDHNLVVCLPNGRPCEERLISKSFQELREKCRLPRVVFHSLRHSSTTYKLKLNRGDIKATQGDTGHAQADMVTSVYAHILDEDRKVNATKMEAAFYAGFANPDLRDVRPPTDPSGMEVQALLTKLQNASPEALAALASFFKEVG